MIEVLPTKHLSRRCPFLSADCVFPGKEAMRMAVVGGPNQFIVFGGRATMEAWRFSRYRR